MKSPPLAHLGAAKMAVLSRMFLSFSIDDTDPGGGGACAGSPMGFDDSSGQADASR